MTVLRLSSQFGCLIWTIVALAACQPEPKLSEPNYSVDEADGMAAASYWVEPEPSGYENQLNEDLLMTNTEQLITDSLRSGEGYFSADGTKLVYQSEQAGENPFYQIYLRDLTSGETSLVSPGSGLTTCAWIHPNSGAVMFSSTHEDPEALTKQAEEIKIRESGVERAYGWDYDRYYDIYRSQGDGSELVNLTNTDGYDAEGSYSSDGTKILFASNRTAYSRVLSMAEQKLFDDDTAHFMDLYVMDEDGSNVKQLTNSPGYDGGPFFNPDGSKIIWRRFNPDGNSAEIWIMDSDGTHQRQLTADAMVSWAPFFHPTGDYFIYSSNVLGHANFELFIMDVAGNGAAVRVTNTEGTDILPVFSPDGTRVSWSSTRTEDGTSQLHISDWDHQKALGLLGIN